MTAEQWSGTKALFGELCGSRPSSALPESGSDAYAPAALRPVPDHPPSGPRGSSAVFEGERDDGGFAQRVAIKIVKWEIDSDAARLQFARERQILAGLKHPNIARLLDGNQREDGTPYRSWNTSKDFRSRRRPLIGPCGASWKCSWM